MAENKITTQETEQERVERELREKVGAKMDKSALTGANIFKFLFFAIVGIICFAYSTILGWSYYGERCIEYLLGKKALIPYKLIFVAVCVIGPVLNLDLVWTVADVLNALMAIPNLVAVLLLSGTIAKDTKYWLAHLDEKDETEIPVIDK